MRFWKAIGLIAISSIFCCSQAQMLDTSSAHEIAMLGTDISSGNGWMATINPAALASCRYSAFAIGYESKYLIPELGTGLLCAILYTSRGAFSTNLT